MGKYKEDKSMSDYQMVAYANDLYVEVKKIYSDVILRVEKGIPVVKLPEGVFEGMGAIMVLENLRDDLYSND